MGRKKIEIKTKKTLIERKMTYSKRKPGILKKAKELSVMCDVPLVLLFFSPADEKSYEIFVGEQCTFEEVLRQYAAVPPEVRSKSKLEAFELIKKPFAKQGKIIDVNHELMGCHSGQRELGDMQNHLSVLQDEINEGQKSLGPLSYLDNINSIDDINLLEEMENVLQNLISHNSTLKVPNIVPSQLELITEKGSSCNSPLNRNLNGEVRMHDVKIKNEFVEGEDFYAFAERPVKHPISIKEERAENTSRYGDGFSVKDVMKPF